MDTDAVAVADPSWDLGNMSRLSGTLVRRPYRFDTHKLPFASNAM